MVTFQSIQHMPQDAHDTSHITPEFDTSNSGESEEIVLCVTRLIRQQNTDSSHKGTHHQRERISPVQDDEQDALGLSVRPRSRTLPCHVLGRPQEAPRTRHEAADGGYKYVVRLNAIRARTIKTGWWRKAL